ncbi:hypothetical protein GCM10011519_17290 [Marmoricola endophyticus]|uniref:Uncharacterized protein n=1 Tax=Marmoricola endophyticus TaxID=2040280 RepID=A0A917BH45_9ACTN|nr:hypothetical protein [Marmoricola endophyticus]GGF44009.1 hypothetical protein GCM10011519_17290 [Marmoricola endophyticus]
MSDGRSEDQGSPESRPGAEPERERTTAASDLLAMWVTGRSAPESPEPAVPPAAADEPASRESAESTEPAGSTGPAQDEEEYVESLWPSDEPSGESFAGGSATEPDGGEQWWPYAADPATPSASEDGATEEPSAPPAPTSMDPRSLDMTTTASWTLADFERYVRNQEDNELAEWIGDRSDRSEPTPTATVEGTEPVQDEVDDAFSAAPGTTAPPAEEDDEQLTVPEVDTVDAVAPAPTPVLDTAAAAAPADGIGSTDDSEDDESEDDEPAEDEADVEWNPPEGEAPVVERAAEPADETPAPDEWSSWDRDALREPTVEPDLATPETAPEPTAPDPGQAELFSDDARVADELPEPADDVWPEAPVVEPAAAPAEDPEPASSLAAVPESTPEPVSASPTWDLREWYDDYGLRWVSGDGGYTWYSDDGQGWDAEHSAVIPVEPGYVPFPGDPRSPGVGATSTTGSAATAPEPDPAPEPAAETVEPSSRADAWSATDAEPTAPAGAAAPADVSDPADADEPDAPLPTGLANEGGTDSADDDVDWSRSTQDTSSFYAALATDDESTPEPASARLRRGRAEPEPLTPPRDDSKGFPEHVEYKPRGAHRPLLILLFIVAAVIAVGAIFWAVSRGNQVVWGIAAGITGLTLCFWWGLLSWTPTLVSVDGPMLEVSRGSDGERFDLRSSKLDIRVDDDVYSRAWRTTIVRPNGTELVIPSSAVDAEEFSRIVAHHRAEVAR